MLLKPFDGFVHFGECGIDALFAFFQMLWSFIFCFLELFVHFVSCVLEQFLSVMERSWIIFVSPSNGAECKRGNNDE